LALTYEPTGARQLLIAIKVHGIVNALTANSLGLPSTQLYRKWLFLWYWTPST